jgi:DNA-binding Lrp family transcriptional regulator
MNISSMSGAARGVYLALLFDGEMTYAEIAVTVGINASSVRRAINELREQDCIEVFQSGNGRELTVRALAYPQRKVDDVRMLCIDADDTEDFEGGKWGAVQAIWEDLFSENNRPHEEWRIRHNARELLAKTGGSTVELYDKLQVARSNPDYPHAIDNPFAYMAGILDNQEKQYIKRAIQERRNLLLSEPVA